MAPRKPKRPQTVTVRMSEQMMANRRATAALIEALRTGTHLTLADFDRYATEPPMTGLRLLDIVLALHRLKAEQWAAAKRAAGRVRTRAAREAANAAAVMQNGGDWRTVARAIHAAAVDPRTGRPWPSKTAEREYLEERFSRSRSAVLRALDPKRR